MPTRILGRSGITVSAMGLGCWAIRGPYVMPEGPSGYGQVSDQESIRAIHHALDLGINFYDTASSYGAGHSERILARAIADKRDEVVLATKFGRVVDEKRGFVTSSQDVVTGMAQECEDSLRRLNTDRIDLYQFHIGDYPPEEAVTIRDALEGLVAQGKIRWYGWSTDSVEAARVFAQGEHCAAIQHRMNMAQDAPALLSVCEQFGLASINRSPLGMGLLTGKIGPRTVFPEDDIRRRLRLLETQVAERSGQIDLLRSSWIDDDRTPVQLALAWLWARSNWTIPVPGFKTVEQVTENAMAMDSPALTIEQVKIIDRIFGRIPPPS